jgi:hypothetical protein
MERDEPNDGGREERPATSSLPTHSSDGVDLTLIRWMLSLTPLERLEMLQRTVRAIREMQDATAHLR